MVPVLLTIAMLTVWLAGAALVVTEMVATAARRTPQLVPVRVRHLRKD